MTSRTQRYFSRKQSRRYRESALAILMPVFENMMMAKDAYLRLTAPRPNYSPGRSHPGGPAFIGEVGPELIQMVDGRMKMTFSRIYPPAVAPGGLGGLATIVQDGRPEIVKLGEFDIVVKNPFTLMAHTTITPLPSASPLSEPHASGE